MKPAPSSCFVHIIGGGLAGCEAAWQLAHAGVSVILSEMRPQKMTPAHRSGGLAELVCSNSFRSDDVCGSAIGLLHAEMRRLGSLVLAVADRTQVPAGGALAVDRYAFSQAVTESICAHPLITVRHEEVVALPAAPEVPMPEVPMPEVPVPEVPMIVATGPLTSDALAQSLQRLTGAETLAFFDAIAPIVYRDSIDFAKAWFQSRYDKGEGFDYINCPLRREQYEAFVAALAAAPTVPLRDWERDTPYFEGCLPIEVMAARGRDTLAFGPMKPVGLRNPHEDGKRPHAVVQLRQDNREATLFNMVGFQTKLQHGEQVRLFRTIPGLENARFARLGGLHRNTFIDSPRLLDAQLRLKTRPSLRFAGQITGCEGYVESAAVGLLAGRFAAAECKGAEIAPPPPSTAIGALLRHITEGPLTGGYQPMNITFGLLAALPEDTPETAGANRPRGRVRKELLSRRALADLDAWLARQPPASRPSPAAPLQEQAGAPAP